MLIKKKKLTAIKGGKTISHLTVAEKAYDAEIYKAKQEAKLIKEEAQKILFDSQERLKSAEERASQVIEEANQEAENIKETVYNEMIDAAEIEAANIKEKAKQILKDLFEVKKKALNDAHLEIIKVALDLAGKIIRYQASIDPNVLKTQVIESIKKATSEADKVQVFVNPIDYKKLEDEITEIEKLFPVGINIVLIKDENIEQGSCIIETKSGQLDATFSTQLETLTLLVTKLDIPSPEPLLEEPSIPQAEATTHSKEKIVQPELKSQEEAILKEQAKTPQQIFLENDPLFGIPGEENVEFKFEQPREEISEINIPPVQAEPPQQVKEEKEIVLESGKSSGFYIDTEDIEIPQIKTKDELIFPQFKDDLGKEELLENEDEILQIQTSSAPLDLPEEEEIVPIEAESKKVVPLFNTQEESLEEDIPFLEYEEEEEVKEKKIETKNILRLKTPKANKISELAKEIEENPEWKNMVEDEE